MDMKEINKFKAGTKEYYAKYYENNKDRHSLNTKRYKSENKEAVNLYDKTYKKEKYSKLSEEEKEKVRAKYRDIKREENKVKSEFVKEYKENNPCCKCDEKRWYVLDFHHLDPNTKNFDLGDKSKFSLKKVKKEIEKCILLCRNCHSEFHFLERENNLTIKEYLDLVI
jgi:hypothetical protein